MNFKPYIFMFVLFAVFSTTYATFYISNDPLIELNTTIKINAYFEDTDGKEAVEVKFVGDIYFGAERVNSFETESVLVEPGDNVTITHKFTPRNIGKYTVKGFVSYGDQLSETKDSSFGTVSQDYVPFGSGWSILAIIALSLLVLFGKIYVDKSRKN